MILTPSISVEFTNDSRTVIGTSSGSETSARHTSIIPPSCKKYSCSSNDNNATVGKMWTWAIFRIQDDHTLDHTHIYCCQLTTPTQLLTK